MPAMAWYSPNYQRLLSAPSIQEAPGPGRKMTSDEKRNREPSTPPKCFPGHANSFFLLYGRLPLSPSPPGLRPGSPHDTAQLSPQHPGFPPPRARHPCPPSPACALHPPVSRPHGLLSILGPPPAFPHRLARALAPPVSRPHFLPSILGRPPARSTSLHRPPVPSIPPCHVPISSPASWIPLLPDPCPPLLVGSLGAPIGRAPHRRRAPVTRARGLRDAGARARGGARRPGRRQLASGPRLHGSAAGLPSRVPRPGRPARGAGAIDRGAGTGSRGSGAACVLVLAPLSLPPAFYWQEFWIAARVLSPLLLRLLLAFLLLIIDTIAFNNLMLSRASSLKNRSGIHPRRPTGMGLHPAMKIRSVSLRTHLQSCSNHTVVWWASFPSPVSFLRFPPVPVKKIDVPPSVEQ